MATAATAVLNAMVIGGTGATGRCLVGALLRDKERFGKVVLVTRRKLENVPEEYKVTLAEEEESKRLVQHVQDLDEISKEKITELCSNCQVFFNTLGTTKAAAGSSQAFYHIDCEIPLKFAEAAKEAGVPHISVLTSAGSKPNSFILYLRTKGELEEKVRALQFPHTSIFQPGMLARGVPNARTLEKLALIFFKGLPVSHLAEAMAWDAAVSAQKGQTSGEPSVTIINSNRNITTFVQEYREIFAPKAAKEEEAKPQAERTQPQEGESPPEVQKTQPEIAEMQPGAEETQSQAQSQAKTQPQGEEVQLQVGEAQTQMNETQEKETKPKPEAEETQTDPEETHPEVEEKET